MPEQLAKDLARPRLAMGRKSLWGAGKRDTTFELWFEEAHESGGRGGGVPPISERGRGRWRGLGGKLLPRCLAARFDLGLKGVVRQLPGKQFLKVLL